MKLWAIFMMLWTCCLKPGRFQDRIVYPLDSSEESNGIPPQTIEGIPESLLLMMKDVNNATEFLRRFVVPEDIGGRAGTDGQMSFVNARRAFAAAAGLEVTPFAVCRPELKVVKLQKGAGAASGVMLWPPCVRVRRCGGCCTSKLLECRPVAVSTVNITVLQVHISVQRLDAFESEGQKVMSLEQHDRCACGCRQVASECVPGLQEYRQAECRCACINQEKALECTGADRIWDSTECACKCRHPTDCSTGFYYSFQTCRCEVFRDSILAAFGPRTTTVLEQRRRRLNRYRTPAATEQSPGNFTDGTRESGQK